MYKEDLEEEQIILENYTYLIKGYREDKAKPSPDLHSRRRNNGYKLD